MEEEIKNPAGELIEVLHSPVYHHDKRSRSYTPNKLTAAKALFRLHHKLLNQGREPPSKLMERHIERQQRAE